MQKVAREFLQFRRGIILKNILENEPDLSHHPPKKHSFQPLKLFSLSQSTTKKHSAPTRTSPLKDSCKTCKERLKCKRGSLPWEVEKKEPKQRGVLPFRKVAEKITGQEIWKCMKPCRYCPSTEPKIKSRRKRKRSQEHCKPFSDQNLHAKETMSECERRKIRTCKKKACNPEIECKNLAPRCGKITKVYPMMDAIVKYVKGSPIPGWQDMHKKAKAKCNKKRK